MPTNKYVKWAVKPQIVCKKNLDDALIQKFVDWVLRNIKVHESPIVRNTLLIEKYGNGVRERITKLLLEFSVRKLHNELISPASEGGPEEAKYRVTGEVIIRDTMLRKMMEGQIRRMQEHHKKMCEYDYCNTPTSMKYSLNAWKKS